VSGPPGERVLLQLLRKQLSKYVFGMHSTLAITNRDILGDRAAIVVDSVSRDGCTLFRGGAVYFPVTSPL